MQLLDFSFPTLAENVGFDEALFRAGEKTGAEYLRFWESAQYGVVLGRISKEQQDVHVQQAQADAIPVLRRSSGGGTVLQGSGCLNFTLVLCRQKRPVLNDLHASYKAILGWVIHALAGLGIEAVFYPISDLALKANDRKFSGNAQHRGKTHILHHGTILYGFNLDMISKYLAMPLSVPAYRGGRSHKDFLCNISISPENFKAALAAQFGLAPPCSPADPEQISSLKNYLK